MKKNILALLLLFPMFSFAILKTWIGNTGDNWTNSSSWSPSGAPATTDDVAFNTSTTVLFSINIQTINSLKITNNATVLFQASGSIVMGYTFGFPLTIDKGATLQLAGITSAAYGLTLLLDGTSTIDGNLDMLGGGNSRAQLLQSVGSTAKITVTGKVRTGFINIGGINADAGSLESSGASTSKLIFESGSEYEIARQNTTTVGYATWAPDATLKITGGQATSNFSIFCSGQFPSQLGTVIWDCPNQGGAAAFYLGTFPYIDTIKGDFIVNNTNGKSIRFAAQNTTSYTTTFKGNFEVKSPSTTIEMFSTAAPVSNPGSGNWIFMKQVNILGMVTPGNNVVANIYTSRKMQFKGSATGVGGTGAQTLAIGSLVSPGVFDIAIENKANGIILNSHISPIKDIVFINDFQGPSKIFLGNHNLTAGINGGRVIGNGWVVTNGTGFLRMPLTIGTPTAFPVGVSESSSDPAGITSNTADTFSVQVRSGFSHPVAKTDHVYDREWNIVSNSTNAQVEFSPDASAGAQLNATGDIVIGHYTGTGWTETPNDCCGMALSSQYAGKFTSFSPFAVGIATGFGSASSGTTYTFTGNGNWSVASNWSNNSKPPASLNAGDKIIINPAEGFCTLDVAYTVSAGAELTVSAGKILKVNGNLTVQ